MGEPAESDFLPSAVGLVWRALVLWLLLILLLTLAYWAPGGDLPFRRARRGAGRDERMQQRDAMRRHIARGDRRRHRATRLGIVTAIAKAALPEERPQFDECLRDRLGREVRKAECTSSPANRRSSRRASPASTCSAECDVVWRPVASAAETSAVFAPASGATALRIVDLPIPDCPINTVCWPSSHGRSGSALRFAESATTG